MKHVRWLAVAGLVAALLLAGCGSQAQDEDDVQIIEDEKEQVYILPDGTVVHGEEASWLQNVVAQLYPADGFKPTNVEEIRRLLGEHFVQPTLPSRFRLVGYASNGNDLARVVSTYWAAPSSKEWIVLSIQNTGTNVRYVGEPLCDEELLERPGTKVSDLYPWASQICVADVDIPGWRAHLWMVNVKASDASMITESLGQAFTALAKQ